MAADNLLGKRPMTEQPLEIDFRHCPGCDSAHSENLHLGREPWNIVQCARCQFVYLDHVPAQDAFESTFAWDVSYAAEKRRRKRKQPVVQWIDEKTRWRLHIFPRPETREILMTIARPGPVLDVGCGDGGQAMKLPDAFTPFGVEIAPRLAERADAEFRKRGGRCLQGDSATTIGAFEGQKFSGVMMNSYLEHEFRPKEVLGAIRDTLDDEAPVVIKVPNFGSLNAKVMGRNWCGIRLPDHVNYLTWRSLKAISEQTGYRIEAPRGTNLPTNDNMWAVLYKN